MKKETKSVIIYIILGILLILIAESFKPNIQKLSGYLLDNEIEKVDHFLMNENKLDSNDVETLLSLMTKRKDTFYILDKIVNDNYKIKFNILNRLNTFEILAQNNYRCAYPNNLLNFAEKKNGDIKFVKRVFVEYFRSIPDSIVNTDLLIDTKQKMKEILNDLNDEFFYDKFVLFKNKISYKDIVTSINNDDLIKEKMLTYSSDTPLGYRYNLFKALANITITKEDLNKFADSYRSVNFIKLNKEFELLNDSDQMKIRSILNKIEVNYSTLVQYELDFFKKEDAMKDFERVDKKYFHINGFIVAETSDSVYETVIFNKKAVFRSTHTRYTSRGRFSTYVQKGSPQRVTTINGFTQIWDTYIQAPKSALDIIRKYDPWRDGRRLKNAKRKVKKQRELLSLDYKRIAKNLLQIN